MSVFSNSPSCCAIIFGPLPSTIQHLFSRIHTHMMMSSVGGRKVALSPPRSPAVARREYVKRPPLPPPPPPHTGIYCVCCLLMGEEEEVVEEEGGRPWVGRLGASVRGFLEEGGVNGGS